jgi:hypothetical protein
MEMTKDRAGQVTDGGARLCERCGATIFADGPPGYCPACLLETGLDLLEGDQAREPIIGEFGDYELLEEIGRGGQASSIARPEKRDLAFEQLEILARLPAGPSYGNLRLDPLWDPLRSDPRFGKIVASLAPTEIASK